MSLVNLHTTRTSTQIECLIVVNKSNTFINV